MALAFIGIDPETKSGGSPTVWVDEDAKEIVIQGWKADDRLRERITATAAPGHEPGIPDGEDVIRVPARLADALRKACDAADRLG